MKLFKAEFFHEYSETIEENNDVMILIMRVELTTPNIYYFLNIKGKRVELKSMDFFSLVKDPGFRIVLEKIHNTWKNSVPRI